MKITPKTLVDFEIIPPVLADTASYDKSALEYNLTKLRQYKSDIIAHLDDVYAEESNYSINDPESNQLSEHAYKYEKILEDVNTQIRNLISKK